VRPFVDAHFTVSIRFTVGRFTQGLSTANEGYCGRMIKVCSMLDWSTLFRELITMVDWLALMVALISIWITFREVRRNNAVCLEIVSCECKSTQSANENGCVPFSQFTIQLRNKGIALHSISMRLGFRGLDGSGLFSFPLIRSKLTGDRDEFSRGMIAEFYLKSYQLKQKEVAFIKMLVDSRKQDAVFNVYSQDFCCYRIPINTKRATIARFWNHCAVWVNLRFTRNLRKTPDGLPLLYTPTILPLFRADLKKLDEFISDLRHESPNASNTVTLRS
jgi:hypothetical protein